MLHFATLSGTGLRHCRYTSRSRSANGFFDPASRAIKDVRCPIDDGVCSAPCRGDEEEHAHEGSRSGDGSLDDSRA